ncbi:MAG: hypothetical protein EHM24_27220 [Acidobacteria bacterium]|nr:MAG: hypothetical protein EHM24_27220 [Acidobacteriota bacterium]RPJ84197.1 MAG: hypothetical protein EHM13_05445 [Acidobacteriota bacterium]
MTLSRATLERRIALALEQAPPGIPILVGACGCGRTTLLRRLADRRRGSAVYLDVERAATTPERFLKALSVAVSAVGRHPEQEAGNARAAYEATLAVLGHATGHAGQPITFLLDEVLELKTFESFPAVRDVLPSLVVALGRSANRFILATRFTSRARRLLVVENGPPILVPVPNLTPLEVAEAIGRTEPSCSDLAPAVHALSDGRPSYFTALCDQLAAMDRAGGGDPVSALVALFAPGGRLASQCAASYELRLHHARGYGALKAIVQILADEEPLTLTEVARRLGRTPGSTRDYLSWLEDVDLVSAEDKRYGLADPLLRLWVRLYCRPSPPSEDDVARETQAYAMTRLAPRGMSSGPGRQPWART